MKQVAHIRQISLALRRSFGDRRKVGDHVVYTFPPAQRIARATETDLRECALGYRARNLLMTARLVSSGKAGLEAWSAMPDADLREKLCALPGVGMKVANCAMLFAYERLRAFPIDVWIERVLKQQYFPRKKKITELRLREFSETYFGEHGGYAQQYLFHHARMAWRRSTMAKNSDDGGGSPSRRRTRFVRPEGGPPPRLGPDRAKASAEREQESDQESERAGQSSCQHPWAEIMFQP
jgi:N-glycosylase/DNA lyase